MTHLTRFFQSTMAIGLMMGFSAHAVAESGTQAQSPPTAPAIYPAKGQSKAQQEKDVSACSTWAKEQTGFDPSVALAEEEAAQSRAPASEAPPPGGAGRGAAAGAAIGAIGGKPGTGAAAGAAAGGVRRHSAEKKEEAAQSEQQQQQTAAIDQQLAGYNKAATACLEGRGYTVNEKVRPIHHDGASARR